MTHTSWPQPKTAKLTANPRLSVLIASYSVRVHWGDGTITNVTVPKGFVTDWASVPSVIEWLWPRDGGHYPIASLIHDWLYAQRDKGNPLNITRKQADLVFLAMMRQQGVKPLVRSAMWFAVRMLGGSKLIKRIVVTT